MATVPSVNTYFLTPKPLTLRRTPPCTRPTFPFFFLSSYPSFSSFRTGQAPIAASLKVYFFLVIFHYSLSLTNCLILCLCGVAAVLFLCHFFGLFQENVGRFKKSLGDFTSLNYWVVRDYYRLVHSVNAFERDIQSLSDEQVGRLVYRQLVSLPLFGSLTHWDNGLSFYLVADC